MNIEELLPEQLKTAWANPSVRRRLAIALAAVAAVALLTAWLHWDQWRIQRRLNRFVTLVSKQEDESPLVTMARTPEIVGFFADRPQIDLGAPINAVADRDELSAIVYQVRSTVERLKITIQDRRLSVKSGGTAVMNLTAEADFTLGGQADRDVREFEVNWVKQDGRWLMSGAKVTSSIRAPDSLKGAGL